MTTRLTTDMNKRERHRMQASLTRIANDLHAAARAVIADDDEAFLVHLVKAHLVWAAVERELAQIVKGVVEYEVPSTPKGAESRE